MNTADLFHDTHNNAKKKQIKTVRLRKNSLYTFLETCKNFRRNLADLETTSIEDQYFEPCGYFK